MAFGIENDLFKISRRVGYYDIRVVAFLYVKRKWNDFFAEIQNVLANNEVYSYDFFKKNVLRNTQDIEIDDNKKIIEYFNGSINVESKLNEGTTFIVSLKK